MTFELLRDILAAQRINFFSAFEPVFTIWNYALRHIHMIIGSKKNKLEDIVREMVFRNEIGIAGGSLASSFSSLHGSARDTGYPTGINFWDGPGCRGNY